MTMSLSGTGNTAGLRHGGWSATARILPYMEGNRLFNAANLSSSRKTRQLHGHLADRVRRSSARARSSPRSRPTTTASPG